ncbi:hypothetical protein O5D80_002722 [Batrachochytrium dendrobatidis]|nr:hypothetical protein O5D80_002722 [Batrachochytrium dendrobatidis]
MLETSLKSVTHAPGIALNISFEHALKDSPLFRSSVRLFADELDELEKWLVNISKICRIYTESLTKTNDIGLAVSRRVSSNKYISLLGNTENIRTVSESMINIHHLRLKMLEGMYEGVINTIQNVLFKDIKNIKEARLDYEKSVEKFEAATIKYAALPKSKESSALLEDAFILYEARKPFIKASISYVSKIIMLKYKLDIHIPDILMALIKVHTDYFEAGWDLFHGIEVASQDLRQKLDNARAMSSDTIKRLETVKNEFEEFAIESAKPRLKESTDHSKLPNRQSLSKSRPLVVVEREGYLFRKSNSGGSVWTRRYFSLKDAMISYSIVATSGKHKGKLMATTALSVALCNVRVSKLEDRRFCFEVETSSKSTFVLQAETEQDMNQWITAINSAKSVALANGAASIPIDVTNIEPFEPSSEDESDGGETLHQLKTQKPRESITINQTTATASSEDESFEIEASELETDGSFPQCADTELISMQDGSASKSDSMIEYSDPWMAKKNQELHHHFKSVPNTEYLLDAISIFFQKDIAIQGRLFITPLRLCFHSNIFGFVNLFVIRLKDVTAVSKKQGPLQGSIHLATTDGTFNLKTYGKCDRAFNNILAAWNNTKSCTPISAQNLYVQIMSNLRGQSDREKELSRDTNKKGILEASQGSSATDFKGTEPDVDSSLLEYALPECVSAPLTEVPCGCTDHLEKKEVDVVLPIPSKKLFDLLFKEKSVPIWQALDIRRGASNRKEGVWQHGPTPTREVSYILAMNNPLLKFKEVDVKETSKIIKQTDWITYCVELKTHAPQVPFSDCFNPVIRYCISWVTKDTCRLIVTIAVNFTKGTIMKSVIKSNAMKGLQETCTDIVLVLKDEIRKENAKRTGNSAIALEFDGADSSVGENQTSGHSNPDSSLGPNGSGCNLAVNPTVALVVVIVAILSLFLNLLTWTYSGTDNRISSRHEGLESDSSILNSPWHFGQIDWSTELKSKQLGTVSPRMREFLQLQFNVTISDAHIPHMLTPSIPDTLTHTLHNMEFGQTHTTLLYWKSIIADIRKEVEILVCMLDDMEKHLVWALYFNWVQDVILSRCGNNQTVGSTNANQICCLQVVEIEAV